jgi:hypothetical protein
VIDFLNENRETEVLAALNRLDIAGLNEVMVSFTQFVKCAEENSISYFDIFPMLQKLMIDLGSLRANKYAETLIQTVPKRFSRRMDLNVIFVCCLVTPAGKKYYGAIERPNQFAASMEAMWQQGIDTLAKMSSYDIAKMIRLLQDCVYNPRQCDSMRDLYSNYRNLFPLPATRRLFIYCSYEKNRSISCNRMGMRKAFLSIT